MNSKVALQRILSVIYISFCIWFLGPILIELFSEPPEGDEVGLAILLTVLCAISVSSIGLWFKPEKLNQSILFKWLIAIEILLLGIAVFLFVYSSWILLVAALAIFYIWIRRLVKRQITNLSNLTWISLFGLVMSVYVFFQLVV